MTEKMKSEAVPWSRDVEIKQVNGKSSKTITIWPGITTLVGPNGSGKTRALRAIKDHLDKRSIEGRSHAKSLFLAAGRGSPFERFRAALDYSSSREKSDAAIGNVSYMDQWWQIESATGVLLALNQRPDLRLKIEARLQQLLDRSVQLSWSQKGLSVHFLPTDGGDAYAANHEASGVLQLVVLLAAIHNDEIAVLVIDEPEISLHPQHQAFLLEEMESVAGDPTDASKKVIVIATHSASMLQLRKVSELPSILCFNSIQEPPAQVAANAEILKRNRLEMLVSRLSTSHRLAMFAERILMVEGASDEIVAMQLARRLGLRMLARNAQILPVGGKGEFIEAAKLFGLMNKQVALVADLDALADNNQLVTYFSALPAATAVAAEVSRSSLADLDKELRDALKDWMDRHAEAVDAGAKNYQDWSGADADELVKKRRLTLARLLTQPETFGSHAGEEAKILGTRYKALLSSLGKLGCFFLRHGAIENYYCDQAGSVGKPNRALLEAAGYGERSPEELAQRYADLLTAMKYIAPAQQVDENLLLMPKLGALLGAVFNSMTSETTDAQLNAIAAIAIRDDAKIFKLANRSRKDELRVAVQMTSGLFQRDTFPFEISRTDNANVMVPLKLPPIVQK